MKKLHLVTGAMLLVLMLGLFGGAASAAAPGQAGIAGAAAGEESAAPTEPRPVRIVGMVAEVRDNGILLRTRLGPVRVLVTEDTTIMVTDGDECVEGSLRDIQVGEPARVAGMLTDRGVVARLVAQCRPSTE